MNNEDEIIIMNEKLINDIKFIKNEIIGNKWKKDIYINKINILINIFKELLYKKELQTNNIEHDILTQIIVCFGSFAYGSDNVHKLLQNNEQIIVHGLVKIVENMSHENTKNRYLASNSLRNLLREKVYRSDVVASSFDKSTCEQLLLSNENSLSYLGSEIIKGSSLEGSSNEFISQLTNLQIIEKYLYQLENRIKPSNNNNNNKRQKFNTHLTPEEKNSAESLLQGLTSIVLSSSDELRIDISKLNEVTNLLRFDEVDIKTKLLICKFYAATFRSNSFSSALFCEILLRPFDEVYIVQCLRYMIDGNENDLMIQKNVSLDDITKLLTELSFLIKDCTSIINKREACLLFVSIISHSTILQKIGASLFQLDDLLTISTFDYSDLFLFAALLSNNESNRKEYATQFTKKFLSKVITMLLKNETNSSETFNRSLTIGCLCACIRTFSRSRSSLPGFLFLNIENTTVSEYDFPIDKDFLEFSFQIMNKIDYRLENTLNVGSKMDIVISLANLCTCSTKFCNTCLSMMKKEFISECLFVEEFQCSPSLYLIKKKTCLATLQFLINISSDGTSEFIKNDIDKFCINQIILLCKTQQGLDFLEIGFTLFGNIIQKVTNDHEIFVPIFDLLEQSCSKNSLTTIQQKILNLILCLTASEPILRYMVMKSDHIMMFIHAILSIHSSNYLELHLDCLRILQNIILDRNISLENNTSEPRRHDSTRLLQLIRQSLTRTSNIQNNDDNNIQNNDDNNIQNNDESLDTKAGRIKYLEKLGFVENVENLSTYTEITELYSLGQEFLKHYEKKLIIEKKN